MLSPLTDLRAAFEIRTGAMTLIERVERMLGVKVQGALVDPGLAVVVKERWGRLAVNEVSRFRGSVLAINARLGVVDREAIVGLVRAGGHGALVDAHGDVVAAIVPASDLEHGCLIKRANGPVAGRAKGRCVLTRPWHVRSLRDECLRIDLGLIGSGQTGDRIPAGSTVLAHAQHRLTIAASAKVYPGTIFDLEGGPIVIADHAVIRPGAMVIGPAYVGEGSTVLERATVRANTAIGPKCKVNGEVGGTIFQGFANKAHDGYLGDAYVGEWVNLGAGTTNSNLLNTYGEIVARALGVDGVPGSNERTGEQFLGCVIGDHVKTAICTRIMTGAIVGTGTMFAASGPLSGTVGRFSWITDGGAKMFRFDKFLEVAKAAVARRGVSISEAYAARLKTLHQTNTGE